MKNVALVLAGFMLFLSSCQFFEQSRAQDSGKPGFASAPVNDKDDPHVIGPRRQLTQVGPRSGEAYFSPDGKKMILQSERAPGNPFYQIYVLDLETGKSELVSPGKGKTTCSWFHPSMKKALFSSTHLDPDLDKKVKEEEEQRKSPQKNKYSWSFDETFDIFEKTFADKKLKRLTSEKGYDAEASYSPDGQWIAFASNRSGYSEKLNPDEEKLFSQDPSSQMEIYIMRADGTEVKRLTHELGYDGGPFFSADGKKITWRRFTPNGASAEIWTMNVDGSEQKALTRLNAMSWAPFFHPSGDYLIFTTNKLGYSNFELFIVDAEGKKDPVRVSYWDGFDGLPVFSPDGQRMAWTHRDEKGESQVYIADWDDAKARSLLGLPQRAPRGSELMGRYSEGDAKRIVSYLASETLAGRMTGSNEEKQMAQDLGLLMKDLGLEPFAGKNFVEEFEFTAGVELGSRNSISLQDSGGKWDGKIETDFMPLSFSKSGEFNEAPVAFAGYGLVAPASETQAAYDSYRDLDVKGKWVLVFREIPEDIANPRRIFLNQVSRLQHKALVAKQAGAVGLLIATGPRSSSKQKVMKLRFDGAMADAGLPVLSISDELAERLLKPSGVSLIDWQKSLDQGEIKGASDLPGVKLKASVDLKEKKAKGHSVLGLLKIPKAKGTLVIGAHGDHLGRGESGSSLARGSEQGQIHFGADDNASGVAALLMIAQEFSRKMKAGEWKPTQNILFAVWSGEEIGLIGSNAFLTKHKGPFSSYLNIDMVGRLRDSLLVQGAGSAKEWRELLEPIGIRSGLSLSLQNDPYLPTDSMAFYMKGIPSLTFFTGSHGEYHTPRDLPSTLNYEGIGQVARVIAATAEELEKPWRTHLTYEKVESSRKQLEGRSFRVYLGTIPDYAQDKARGVRISGTSKDSPAEKAGLLEGDVIRELAGTKIENIYDYVYVLQALKPNQKVPIEVERKGKSLKFEITPTVKE